MRVKLRTSIREKKSKKFRECKLGNLTMARNNFCRIVAVGDEQQRDVTLDCNAAAISAVFWGPNDCYYGRPPPPSRPRSVI